jgi:hypothetical protein
MALVGSVLVKFKSEYAEYLAGAQKVRAGSAATTEQIANDAKKGAAKSKSAYGQMLSDLNSQFGKRSSFGKTLKLLAGGGVIGAAGMAASEFDEMTKKAEAMAVAIHQGGDEARKQAAEFLVSIPIVGKIGDGFARIYEIARGTASYVADMKTATEATDLATDAMAARLKLAKDNAKELAEHVQSLFDHVNGLVRRGVPLKLFQIDKETRDAIDKVDEGTAKKKAGPDLKAIQDKATKLRDQLANMSQSDFETSIWRTKHWVQFGDSVNPNYARVAGQLRATNQQIKKAMDDIEHTAFWERMTVRAKGFADKAAVYAGEAADKFQAFLSRWLSHSQRQTSDSNFGRTPSLNLTEPTTGLRTPSPPLGSIKRTGSRKPAASTARR